MGLHCWHLKDCIGYRLYCSLMDEMSVVSSRESCDCAMKKILDEKFEMYVVIRVKLGMDWSLFRAFLNQ